MVDIRIFRNISFDGVSLDIEFLITTKQDSTHTQNISISTANQSSISNSY